MEIQSIQKNIRNSPRKLQLVADMVRNMTPLLAMQALKYTPQAAAIPLSKAIQTAMANAKQLNLNADNLRFKKLEINQGLVMKRSRPTGRGFISGYKKRSTNIKIILSDEVPESKKLIGKMKSVKLDKKIEEKEDVTKV